MRIFIFQRRKSSPSNEELVTLCSEFLNGGTDTTGRKWGIAQLITNPEVQTKLYNEIKSTSGDRKVDEKDVEKTRSIYMQWVKELPRKHPPTYFVLVHAVSERTAMAGYDDLPINANVEFYSHGKGENRKVRTNPEKYNPDRFVSGGEDADTTGVTGENDAIWCMKEEIYALVYGWPLCIFT
ncbi:hypothetical protein NC653_026359 [Populus alba x Populus x berolinensis]|uniref:Uncharacterized protein n=2 Tax=Populus TaxID=3689 RepID=A0A4U5R5Q2_POPAL|nr:hypothetical protein NC653_026359 [Populus alba x Populus x berolinensis]TKS17055.1 hypothetical protein D5086_0000018860 [Populus alba]